MVLTPHGRQAHRRGTVRNGQQRLAAGPRGARPRLRSAPAVDRALHRAERRRRRRHPSAGKAGIWELEADANAIYGTGWVYANKTIGNLEGLFSAEPGNGAIRWIADCHGDHYGVYSDGTNVYSTGHEHSCETANGMPQGSPSPGNMRNATVDDRSAEGHPAAHVERQQHLRRLERLPRAGVRELVPGVDHGRRRRRTGRLDRDGRGRLPADRRRAGVRQRPAVAGHHPVLAATRRPGRTPGRGCRMRTGCRSRPRRRAARSASRSRRTGIATTSTSPTGSSATAVDSRSRPRPCSPRTGASRRSC